MRDESAMHWMTGIGVNLLVPLLGVVAFVLLCRRMRRTHVPSPPFFSYFILFATYGGLLMVCLTSLFWRWSGLASLDMFFLVVLAPFLTTGIALGLRNRRTLSTFHRGAFIASIAYSCLALPALGWLVWDQHSRWVG